MKIRMVHQMSGPRPDGRPWPAVGETLDVSDQEGMELCRLHDGHSHPIAVPVETNDPRVETRVGFRTRAGVPDLGDDPDGDNTPESGDGPNADSPPWEEPGPAPPPKRGPGRPRKDSLPS
jgi:hypothetical protein